MRAFIGGDPGVKGGIAVVTDEGHMECYAMPSSEVDTLALCRDIASRYPGIRGLIERVWPMPDQGVNSCFTFGGSYKEMRMGFLAAGIGFDDILPKKWQIKGYSLHRKKADTDSIWKGKLRARAKQLYPNGKITNLTADAILIAHYQLKGGK